MLIVVISVCFSQKKKKLKPNRRENRFYIKKREDGGVSKCREKKISKESSVGR